ncbi:MAG: secretion protein [Methanosphaera sp. rholeuAM130]|nr:MAG: secretion protein [Methanosphaera sp. rholeuAM130]
MNENCNLKLYEIKTNGNLKDEEEQEYISIRDKIIQLQVNNPNLKIDETLIARLSKNKDTNIKQILKKLKLDSEGYGKINDLLKDDNLEEIMVINDKNPVYVYHREMGMMITNITLDNNEIRQIIEKIANEVQRKIDKQTPLLDARLADGSRINATIPPVTPDGPTLTIRKFKKTPITIFDLIKTNTLSSHLAAFLWMITEGMNSYSSNIIIAGGTGSGKTTTLNCICSFIPPYERVITIEDTMELQINHKHIIRCETRPPNIENKGEITMDMLLKNSLRQRPDKLIVGEVRSKEANTLFGALNTGHSGMGTLHANSSHETIVRLNNPPMNVPKIMINSIDFIVMQKRLYNNKKGSIRRITEVVEVTGMESDTLQLNKIYEYDPNNDKIEFHAISCNVLNKIANMNGFSYKDVLDEIDKREKYLMEVLENDLENIDNAEEIINNYYDKQNN